MHYSILENANEFPITASAPAITANLYNYDIPPTVTAFEAGLRRL
jgi:hypothetical protein